MSDLQDDLFAAPIIPQPRREYKQPGGVVAEHNRIDRQRRVAAKAKRLGPPTGRQSTSDRFRRFHNENPHVYVALIEIAREARRRGLDQWSIAGAFEVARFERKFGTTDRQFKMPNDFKPHYARLIMQECPDLDGFFETRELRTL